mmetsp:Transcript_4030/g.8751  ORF Transcript_4030/g.8751 Transcript_4030/m.8751 type:complete len:392 (+) Transcript_4030:207-1382(+)
MATLRPGSCEAMRAQRGPWVSRAASSTASSLGVHARWWGCLRTTGSSGSGSGSAVSDASDRAPPAPVDFDTSDAEASIIRGGGRCSMRWAEPPWAEPPWAILSSGASTRPDLTAIISLASACSCSSSLGRLEPALLTGGHTLCPSWSLAFSRSAAGGPLAACNRCQMRSDSSSSTRLPLGTGLEISSLSEIRGTVYCAGAGARRRLLGSTLVGARSSSSPSSSSASSTSSAPSTVSSASPSSSCPLARQSSKASAEAARIPMNPPSPPKALLADCPFSSDIVIRSRPPPPVGLGLASPLAASSCCPSSPGLPMRARHVWPRCTSPHAAHRLRNCGSRSLVLTHVRQFMRWKRLRHIACVRPGTSEATRRQRWPWVARASRRTLSSSGSHVR